jgi:hypothetical protein
VKDNARGNTCSGCRLTSALLSEIDAETVRAWCAMVNNSRPQEDRLGGEAVPVYILSDDDSCRALSDTFPRFFQVTNVPSLAVRAKEMWRSGQRRILVSRRRWTIMQRMVVDMGGYDVRLSYCTLLDAALRDTHTFHSF